MSITLEQLEILLNTDEDENLEFKQAKADYDFEKLVKYCVALANEGGGKVILGVTDKKPRKIVGTQAFREPNKTRTVLFERLHIRIEISEVNHPDGRVLIIDVPQRPLGRAIECEGQFLMRAGDSLRPMTIEQIKKILDEDMTDYSAQICEEASLVDLDPDAIKRFKNLWISKSRNDLLGGLSDAQLLTDAELIIEGKITIAALILFGTREGIGKYISHAEVIFEYRNDEASIAYNQREEYRKGFFLFFDKLWETINLRNDLHQYQDGLFQKSIPTLNESVVREAVLNAISHRDYRLQGSITIRQVPKRLEVVSPGGFPAGITIENILYHQVPRNRRIAEAFQKCGLVERSGQGVDRMFRESIREGKPIPDFSRSDDYHVWVDISGDIQDVRFLRFLEEVGKETLASFTTEDFILLEAIHREENIPDRIKARIPYLKEKKIIEVVSRGRGTRYILSRSLYKYLEKPGSYTRLKGLNRETNKALIEKHVKENPGCKFWELRQVLPDLSKDQIKKIMQSLKREGKIRVEGMKRAAVWFPVSPDD